MATNWHGEALEHERQAAHARLQAGREDVAAIADLVKEAQGIELEQRLADRAREAEQLENTKAAVDSWGKVLREEERREDKARLQRGQAEVAGRLEELKARLGALRLSRSFGILDGEDNRLLAELERLAEKHGW